MHFRNREFRSLSLLFSTLLICSLGCGPDYVLVPASGTITLDGKPLANGTILTQPIGTKDDPNPGPGSGALTNEDGSFVLLSQVDGAPGAVPGPCLIKIVENDKERASNDDTAVVVRSKIPYEYQKQKAEYTIPEEGTDAMNFDLEPERSRRK